jgi:hypothetical protein
VGWDWLHSVRRPLFGLLHHLRMMDEWEWSSRWKWMAKDTEVFGENLPQCHLVHHKSHMTWTELEPWPPRKVLCTHTYLTVGIVYRRLIQE